MKIHIQLLMIVLHGFVVTLAGQSSDFDRRIDNGVVECDSLNEASGLAASRKNAGVLWSHNDSGDINRIYALDVHGNHLGVYYIEGVPAIDWEDMAIWHDSISGQDYIYIGDIGDNFLQRNEIYVYRITEPDVDVNQSPVDTLLSDVEIMTLQYPYASRDSETLLIDPLTGDIFLVTKEADRAVIYRAAYPQSTIETITLEDMIALDFGYAVGGDISSSSREILIKTYDKIYYWSRSDAQSIEQALSVPRDSVYYQQEPWGESVCWAADEAGYYTLSEEFGDFPAHLYYYPRNRSTNVSVVNYRPDFFKLHQNYPNPFNCQTSIEFDVKEKSRVVLTVYDLQGHEVETLVDYVFMPGKHTIPFDAKHLASGVYFYKIQRNDTNEVKKMLLVK